MKELHEYRHFCTPREIEKHLYTLTGILAGIEADHQINQAELEALQNWCDARREFAEYPPFCEILPMIDAALSDGILTAEEYHDISFVCENIANDSVISEAFTRYIQEFEGFLHGILADGEINDDEVYSLRRWLNTYTCLRGTYPYDEINALVEGILADGIITDDERNKLLAYCSNFVDTSSTSNLSDEELENLRQIYQIDGICALDPQIELVGNEICFTGTSSRTTRNEIAQAITAHGGKFNNNVTKKTRYLVVGDDGNPCWMFACYGRKVEKAVQLRKQGLPIQIVHESDLWKVLDAAQ